MSDSSSTGAYHPEPTPAGDDKLATPLVGVVDTITKAELAAQLLESGGIAQRDIAIIDRTYLLRQHNARGNRRSEEPADFFAQLSAVGLEGKRAATFAADVAQGRVLIVVDPPADQMALAWNIINYAYDSDSAR